MISPKKLIKLARKWQKMASVANKGHFVVCTTDKKRFIVPLEHLKSNIFGELFRVSEEEFALPMDGPITLPCDSTFLKYVILLVQKQLPEDLQKALLASMATYHCSETSSLTLVQSHRLTLIYGF